jgi:hypothetical protein
MDLLPQQPSISAAATASKRTAAEELRDSLEFLSFWVD